MELGARPIILGDSVFRDPSKAFFRRGETQERSLCCHTSRYECPVTVLVWVLNPSILTGHVGNQGRGNLFAFEAPSLELFRSKGRPRCVRDPLSGLR
jgi:hypothetical protein